MVKTIKKMKKVSLSFPERPKKTDKDCCDNRRLAVAVASPPLRCNNRRGDNASPSPRPPFCPPSSSSRPRPLPPHKNSDNKCDRHRHRRSLSLPVLLPPPTPFVPPPSPLPPSHLSGCVHCAGHSGSTTTPAVIGDGPNGRTTLATVPRQRRRRRRQRRRSATDATAPTPGAAWTTHSSAWRTGSSSARSSRKRQAPRRRQWGVQIS